MVGHRDHVHDTEMVLRALAEPMATLALELRCIIREAVPHAAESVKWGMPVYHATRVICAIRPATKHVALQFYTSGFLLNDPEGRLEGSGKRMRHVKIRSMDDIDRDLFTAWIKQAAAVSIDDGAGQDRHRSA